MCVCVCRRNAINEAINAILNLYIFFSVENIANKNWRRSEKREQNTHIKDLLHNYRRGKLSLVECKIVKIILGITGKYINGRNKKITYLSASVDYTAYEQEAYSDCVASTRT